MRGTPETTGPIVALARDGGEAAWGLSAAECRTCSSLPPHLRADWRASRRAAKQAAAEALRLPEIVLEAGPPVPGAGARLRLLGPDGDLVPAPVSLSVSHRDGRGAAVVDAPERGVGIDLEREDAVPEGSERFFVTAAEREEAGPLTPAALWALKEAAWKAVGCGDDTPFTAVRLRFDGNGRLEAIEVADRSFSARGGVSAPWPGYVVAVVRLQEERG